MATTNHGAMATPPTTPPALSKAQILGNVLSLATQFSTCVEAFNLIHPSKDSDHTQKVALAKLGVQQGRLLIFGDAVGISSPPANIARHMIPSHPGATNPDPTAPVNFGVRDPKLDEPLINEQVRAALDEIAGRPSHLSREELMEKYGLKSPKRFGTIEYPALDTNRLEAFREKYALLQDLVRQSGTRTGLKRGMSMTMQHWTVKDVFKFDEFVRTVRLEVDGLIALLGVVEQVDRGMKSDIRAMGWHPDLSGMAVKHDWEKLRIIREACASDYPEYVAATDVALKYISEELRGAGIRATFEPYAPPAPKPATQSPSRNNSQKKEKEKDKRPKFLSQFKLKSWSSKTNRERAQSVAGASSEQDPPRSKSEAAPSSNPVPYEEEEENALKPVRSKSLSQMPDEPAPFNLDTRLQQVPTHTEAEDEGAGIPIRSSAEEHRLTHADTANSLIDRHDMYKGVGRVETKDIRAKAHDWAHG